MNGGKCQNEGKEPCFLENLQEYQHKKNGKNLKNTQKKFD